MFCPKCCYEYEGGISNCPDCEVALVANLPLDESKQKYDEPDYKDWVQLARLTSQYYSEMVLEGLHAKKIPAVINSGAGFFGQTGQMGTSFQPIGGGYSLYIPLEFIKDADIEANVILGEEWEKSKLVDIE